MKYFLLLLPLLFISLACKKESHSSPPTTHLGNPLIADPAIQAKLELASTKQEVINLIGYPTSTKPRLVIHDGIWDFWDEWTYTYTNLDTDYHLILKVIFLNDRKWAINKIES